MTADKTEHNVNPVAAIDYSHPLEQWLDRDWVRFLLRKLTADRPGDALPHLERALLSYGDPKAPAHERLVYWPIHKVIDRLAGSMTREQLRKKIADHKPTLRGIIGTARSVARFGLTTPQRWINPLFVVWNFTNACNLRCKHCYQDSGIKADDELTLPEKIDIIDQFGQAYVAMVAFAGGEPTLSGDLDPVLKRCQHYGIHTTIASNGWKLTAQRCRQLADVGLRYAEVSLDSINPAEHDQFRGVPGAWQKSVHGIKNVVATKGLRAGVAMCVHRDNFDQVERMIQFAIEIGASCFAHFNFIPVGRGKEMVQKDITPQQREELLDLLHTHMQSRKIGIISTAPQFGRFCMMHAGQDELVACSHAGNGPGTKARVVAKYLGGCGAGRTYACLQPSGNLTPCVYMPNRTMGNVREKAFTKIFRQHQWLDLLCDRDERQGHCAICDFRNYCGGCRARADAYFDRLDHADPGCIRNLDQWEKLTNQVNHTGIGSGTVTTPQTRSTASTT